MKFLCDQCKAKYQIADEKVQGKTLRMKCRKCGHVIEIRAANDGGTSGETMQLDALNAEAAVDALNKAKPAPAKPGAAPKPAASPAKPAAPAAKGAPPRPAAGVGATPKPAGAAAPRPGAAAPRPGAPRPGDPKESGALANAFNKAVASQKKPDVGPPSSHHQDPPVEEWYVAIDEVPVGPIRLTELRQKYAQGAVTDDSLVWREGFEEWRPLRTLPDLHNLVKEEVSGAFHPPGGARNSMLPASGNQARPQPQRTSGPSGARPSMRPQHSPTPGPVAARGNVIPFAPSRGAAAARKLEEDEEFDDEATQIAASPLMLPKEPPPGAPKIEEPKVVADPFASAPIAAAAAAPPPAAAAAAPTSLDHAERLTMLDRVSNRVGVSRGSVALIAAACVLVGVVVAVLLVKPKVVERVVEKRVEVPVSVEVPVPMGGPTATVSAEPSGSAPKVAQKGGTAGPTGKPAAAPTASGGSNSLKGLDMGPAGPSLGGPDPGGPAVPGGAGALSGGAVEGVVSSKRVGVRKQCYEGSGGSDKGDATVKIQIKIAPDGSVTSSDIVQSDGPAAGLVGPCIQRMSKTWRFPASDSGGTFAIPFIFKT